SCSCPAASVVSTLSLHDALPISLLICGSYTPRFSRTALLGSLNHVLDCGAHFGVAGLGAASWRHGALAVNGHFHHVFQALGNKRSEEHTSELQSRENLVCRLLLE